MNFFHSVCVWIVTFAVVFVKADIGHRGKKGHRHNVFQTYNWSTALPTGSVIKESAKVIPGVKLIYITSNVAPNSAGYQKSTTLMDFRRNRMAVRFNLPRKLLRPLKKKQACFITENVLKFYNTRTLLEIRSNSSLVAPVELGQTSNMMAGKRVTKSELRKMGFVMKGFCRRAMKSNNVYLLKPFEPIPGSENMEFFTASGLVPSSLPALPTSLRIAVDPSITGNGRKNKETNPSVAGGEKIEAVSNQTLTEMTPMPSVAGGEKIEAISNRSLTEMIPMPSVVDGEKIETVNGQSSPDVTPAPGVEREIVEGNNEMMIQPIV